MSDANQPKFTFEIEGFDKDTFHVVRFDGEEGLSMLYRFEIVLYAPKSSQVDFDKALSNTATLTIKRRKGSIPFHGILAHFDQLTRSGPYTFYRAVLVPKAWLLTLTTHNQVFLNQNVGQFLDKVIKDGGLSPGIDYKLSLMESYPAWEYVCQYGETHYDFVSRWMERDGLYYFFEQGDSKEKLVVTDTFSSHGPMPQGEHFLYSPPSSMQAGHEEEIVTDFILTQRRLPQKVQLKDYNYRTPSLDLSVEEEVSDKGVGTHYIYGLHFLNLSRGRHLAKIRVQDFKCRQKVYHGVSTIPFVRPGYVFSLSNHFQDAFNAHYQTVFCRHEGSQEAWLASGLGLALEKDRESLLYYRNEFTAIPAETQYRMELTTGRPRISGTLSAKVDAEGSGQYAEVDSQGRYKIILPFDLSGRKNGHASAWVRMAQPYAGSNFGMHMPLHKGCEVLISFEDGDPDRPVIAAAVPNPENASPVTGTTQTQSRTTTAGGNQIHMEDKEGSERILLNSTAQNNFIRIGAHNDPASGFLDDLKEMATDGIKISTPQYFSVTAEFSNAVIIVENTQTNLGLYSCNTIGMQYTLNAGASVTTNCAAHTEFSPVWYEMRASVRQADAQKEQTVADLVQTVGAHTQTIGEHTQTIGEHTQTIGEHTHTIGEHTQTIGEHTQTIGEHTQTIGEHTQTIGEHTHTIGEHTQTIGEHTHTIGALEQTVGEHTQTIGEHTQTIGELEQNAGEINSIAGDVSNLWGVVNVVAGEVGYV